ncbi:MAG: hypothetical protein KatS3mg057_1791 [Herpetosiphonaceae bacterium]|nr:MAG: hypothetical protein KatS3mg057_1791 [Herpetosiphonaceae bacterium]
MYALEEGLGLRRALLIGLAMLAVWAFFFVKGQQGAPFISPWRADPNQQVAAAAQDDGTPLVATFVAQKDGLSVVGPPTISPQQIDEILRSYGSPAVGTGQAMYDFGIQYGIDPAFCLAFFIHESTAGTRGVATVTKSVGNIRTTPGYEDYQGYRRYSSWEEGIEDWYKLIRELYVDEWGLTTVEEILPVYAPPADNNDTPAYINTVRRLVESWRRAGE